jgi:hypothetical protein
MSVIIIPNLQNLVQFMARYHALVACLIRPYVSASTQSPLLNILFAIGDRPNHKRIVQQGAALRSGGAGPYQAYRLGRAPGHKLNNIWEIGYRPNHKRIVQQVATLPFKKTLAYQACSNSRASDNELNNILEIGDRPIAEAIFSR